MQLQKRLFSLLLAVTLLLAVSAAAYAHEAPDLSRPGSIQITMHQGETVVGGGTLTLYRVGAVREDDGNYSFVLTGDFTGCGEALTEVQSAGLAKKLAQYARNHSLTGTTKTIGTDGKASFPELEPGLYLLVQNKAAGGYQAAEPFLVSVPLLEDGRYLYDVDASPKVELVKEPATPTTNPPKPTEPSLPQTGQLNWPVPVLVVSGLGLFSAGWALRSGKKKDSDEK